MLQEALCSIFDLPLPAAQEDNLQMRLKKKGLPPWKEIHRAFIRAFSDRSIGSLQVRYCNELKGRDSESDDK